MSSVADVVELDEARVRRGSIKDDDFETAGDMLRAAREAREMSLEDVAEATNIRSVHIESIEAMQIDRLPVAAYTTGFVKAYAALMDLPAAPLVSRFRQEAGYASSGMAPQVSMPQNRELSGGRELSLIAVVAILAFIIWVAWQVMREPEQSGPIEIAGTPLQERPIDARSASYGGSNEVPVADLEPNPDPDPEPVPGMETPAAAAAAVPQSREETAVADALSGNEAGNAGAAANAEAMDEPVAAEATTDLPFDVELLDPALAEIAAEPVNEPAADPGYSQADALTAAANGLERPETARQEEAARAAEADIEAGTDQGEGTDELSRIIGQAATETGEPGSDTDTAAEEVVYTEPVTNSRVSPIYPRRCERLSSGTETVFVTYDINSRGQPTNVRVTRSTNDCFNPAAISAVSRWSFQPATRNGSPVPVYTRSTRFRFELPQ